MNVKNRQTLIFNWDITAFGQKYVMKNVKLKFTPTHFRMKQVSIYSPAIIPNQGTLIINSDMAENHIPYLAIIKDNELISPDSEFVINKNKANASDVVFYVERLAENPAGYGGTGNIEQINILDPLDMDIIFSIEFLEYEK